MKYDLVTDCIIVGGGIIGTTIARQLLAKNLGLQIIVIERSVAAGGTSRYSAGLHIPYGHTDRVKTLSSISEKEYLKLINTQLSYPIRPLSFTAVTSSDTYGTLTSDFNNPPTKSTLEEASLPNLGHLIIEPNEVLFSIEGSHYTNVPELISCYIKEAHLNPNIQFWEGVNITNIVDNEKEVQLTLQDGRTIFARNVILSPGPWVNDKVFKPFIKHLGIRIKKIVSLHINKLPTDQDNGLYFFDHNAFLLPLHKLGYWLFSYKCQEWDVSPDTSKLAIKPEDRNFALSILRKYYPNLINHVTSGRVFCDAYSPTLDPIVSPLTDNANIIFAGACSGSGYRLAPAIAEEAIAFITK